MKSDKIGDRPNYRKRCAKIIKAALIAIAIQYLFQAWLGPSGRIRWTYRMRRSTFAGIIDRVKEQNIPVGTQRSYRVAPSLDPETLVLEKSTCADYDDSVGKVGVYRRDSAGYVISIVIEDEGHFGMYGLMYSDGPLEMTGRMDDPRSVNGAAPLVFAGGQIDDHWWYAYNNLF